MKEARFAAARSAARRGKRTGATLLAWLQLASAASPAMAWTMYYDGFAYERYSDNGYLLGAQVGYELGDPVRHRTQPIANWSSTCSAAEPVSWCTYQPAVCAQYSPGPWAAANNNGAWGPPGSGVNGYWPFIINYNLNPPAPMPAATGHAVECVGTASNIGKVVRVSPINLSQSPPTGPFRTINRGKVYYSAMVWVIESTVIATPGDGAFHAGFNNQPPEACLCYSNNNACTLQTAVARLLLRRAQGSGTNIAFNVGIQSHAAAGSNASAAWAGADVNPPYGTVYPGGPDPATAILVVASYEFKNNWGASPITNDDVSSLWVNPNPATFGDNAQEPPPTATSTGGDIPELAIRSFFLRNGPSGGTAGAAQREVFDELRIGTSWADVTSNVACTPPAATSITPSSSMAGQQVLGVQITGDNFIQGVTQVWLKMAGEPDIQANNVDVTDPQHLVCNFAIPEAAADGMRDVVVITCPDSPGTLAATFAIGAVCHDPRYDLDGDTFVDMDDFAAFQRCYTGDGDPTGTFAADTCGCLNSDGDMDIDLTDLVAFQACASGSGVAADPGCAN